MPSNRFDPVQEPVAEQSRLIAALRSAPSAFATAKGEPCPDVDLIETHISYVLLAGHCAYKIKKAVDLGFLDFTTLQARRHYCEQELVLNRRLAPSLYLDVVAISGTIDRPVVGGARDARDRGGGGDGPPVEYAVRMVRFPQAALASRLVVGGDLRAHDIDTLAEKVAEFHARSAVAPVGGTFGRADQVRQLAMQTFERLRPLLDRRDDLDALDALARWSEREHAALHGEFTARLRGGFVRECHGDLHLGNIARIDGEMTIFDCIEFNDEMRWIDVMSEVAFTVMDLADRGRSDFAHRFVNAYLEITGEYAGLPLLRFYVVCRAMVRALVARLRVAGAQASEARRDALAEYEGYLGIAEAWSGRPRRALVITHGLAGSGKTTLSQALLERLRAIRIRTDVERKRAHGLGPLARRAFGVAGGAESGVEGSVERSTEGNTPGEIESGLYTAAATKAVYRQVLEVARGVVSAGYVAIVDGAFLKRWQRDLFRRLAAELQVPFAIVSFETTEAVLRQRVARRAKAANDASDATVAVLEHQLWTQQPLASDESAVTVVYDSGLPLEHAGEGSAWDGVLTRLLVPADGADEHG